MLKVVVDTNVIISGIFFKGIPGKIIERIADGKFKLVLSELIIDEYTEVITRYARKNKISNTIPLQTINLLISNFAIVIEPNNIPTPPCDDPDDVMFLQAAIAGKAKYLVSGDKHLLDVGKYRGGVVMQARDFMSLT